MNKVIKSCCFFFCVLCLCGCHVHYVKYTTPEDIQPPRPYRFKFHIASLVWKKGNNNTPGNNFSAYGSSHSEAYKNKLINYYPELFSESSKGAVPISISIIDLNTPEYDPHFVTNVFGVILFGTLVNSQKHKFMIVMKVGDIQRDMSLYVTKFTGRSQGTGVYLWPSLIFDYHVDITSNPSDLFPCDKAVTPLLSMFPALLNKFDRAKVIRVYTSKYSKSTTLLM